MLPRNINDYTPDVNIDSLKKIIIIRKRHLETGGECFIDERILRCAGISRTYSGRSVGRSVGGWAIVSNSGQ